MVIVVNLYILHILEHILAVALQPVHVNVTTEHERIGPVVQLQVFDVDAVAPPEHFVGVIHLDIFDLDVVHFAEHFRRVDDRIFHRQMVRIPQCRTPADSKIAVLNRETVHMPKRIVPFKAAVRRHDITTLFDGRFAGKDCHVVQMQVVRGKQRTFTAKFFVFYQLHKNNKNKLFICCLLLFQVLVIELLDLVEWNLLSVVIQVCMDSSGHNQQLFVVTFQLFESIFAEIAGMRFFAMHHEDSAAYLVAVSQNRHVDKRERRGFVPSVVGVKRTLVVTTRCLVVSMIIFDELRSIVGQRVYHASCTGIRPVTVIFCPLRV